MKGKLKIFGLFGVALFCAVIVIAPQTALAEMKGQDYPNEKCQRNNKDGSTTTGQCSSVCKDLTVSTTKDVNSGLRTCKQARIVGGLVGHGGRALAASGGSGVAYATTSIKCGEDHYDVSTGNSAGKCTTNRGSKNEIEGGGCGTFLLVHQQLASANAPCCEDCYAEWGLPQDCYQYSQPTRDACLGCFRSCICCTQNCGH